MILGRLVELALPRPLDQGLRERAAVEADEGLLLGSIFGLLAGAVMMYIAWQHNSQGAFHGGQGVNWG